MARWRPTIKKTTKNFEKIYSDKRDKYLRQKTLESRWNDKTKSTLIEDEQLYRIPSKN